MQRLITGCGRNHVLCDISAQIYFERGVTLLAPLGEQRWERLRHLPM
jgi:hypothetical protein